MLAPALVASACSDVQLRSGRRASHSVDIGLASRCGRRVEQTLGPRTDFCGVLSKQDVTAALGGPVTRTAHYGNGDEFEVRPGHVDVSHEYGCVFEAGEGSAARAWVFARPVAGNEARMLVRRARHQRRCSFPDPVRFGEPV